MNIWQQIKGDTNGWSDIGAMHNKINLNLQNPNVMPYLDMYQSLLMANGQYEAQDIFIRG